MKTNSLPAFKQLSSCVLPVLFIMLSTARAATNETDLVQLPLESLLNIEVSTVSKFPQKTLEAPAATTIITSADIKNYGYRTLADILRSARGFYTTYDRNYEYLGERGFGRSGDYSSRILLLVDGYRANETIYDSATTGTEFFLDVDLIDRVEIVRGPGSSVYGSNALLGIINVITKSGKNYNGLETSGEIAGFDTDKERVTYGRKHDNGVEWLLSGSRYDRGGEDLHFPEYDTPATNNGVAKGLDGDRYKNVYGKLSYAGFILAGAYSKRIKGIPAASYGTVFNDPRSQTTDSQAMLDLKYYRTLDDDLDMSGHVYYGGYFYDGVYPYDPAPVTINRDQSRAEWWGTEIKAIKKYSNHKIVLGGEFQDNFRQDGTNYNVDPYFLFLNSRQSSYRYGFYAQDELDLGHDVLFNAGLRYDYYSNSGSALNPRLALIWSPWTSTSLKLLYGTAFRAPNNYELLFGDTFTTKSNPGLKPEEIVTYEFIAEHYLQPNFRLTLGVYRNQISNLINRVTDPADGLLVFTNLGQANTNGAELEAERLWDNGARLRTSYAWQSTRDGEGAVFSNSPEHMAKLNFSAPLPLLSRKLRGGLELQYTSSRQTLSHATTKGYWLANLTLMGEQLAPGVDVSATLYNLLDQHYSLPVGEEFLRDAMVQDGLNFRVKLTVRY